MQGRQLARGSALSSCFAKKEEPGQGTDPAALRPRLAMCSASTASLKHPRQIRAPRTARRSAWVAQEAEGSRLISYFSTLCTEQCQLKSVAVGGLGKHAVWRSPTALSSPSANKNVYNIRNRTSEEFKNRALPMICKCLPLLRICEPFVLTDLLHANAGKYFRTRAPMNCKCRLLLLMANNLWSQSSSSNGWR